MIDLEEPITKICESAKSEVIVCHHQSITFVRDRSITRRISLEDLGDCLNGSEVISDFRLISTESQEYILSTSQ